MEVPLQGNCRWKISGPQRPQSNVKGMQVRYCYPQELEEQSYQKAGTLWTCMQDKEVKFRLLHIYEVAFPKGFKKVRRVTRPPPQSGQPLQQVIDLTNSKPEPSSLPSKMTVSTSLRAQVPHEAAMLVRDSNGYTPLFYAIKQNNVRMVEHFLRIAPEAASSMSRQGELPLHYAAMRVHLDPQVFALLLKHYPQAACTPVHQGNYPLHIVAAIYNGDSHLIDADRQRMCVLTMVGNASPLVWKMKNGKGQTVLHCATLYDKYSQELSGTVQAGRAKQLSAVDERGHDCNGGFDSLKEIYRQNPAALHASDESGRTVFHYVGLNRRFPPKALDWLLELKNDAGLV